MAKMPRLVRGMMPQWMTSVLEISSFSRAALIGSMSPIRSAMETSGVASFSWYRSLRDAPFDGGFVAHIVDELSGFG